MGSQIRQSELFAGQLWQVLYTAFTDINFNASDPPSINAAMINYIQTNYPENFNDWIEASEFSALIDLLSWLGGTLAFKTDLNARESFLDTAETRQAILRLARFLSYNPSRNQCAQGIVKLVSVLSDDNVYDSYGTNLNNQTINWDDPDDPDWYERFITVLNDALIPTNQFGVPLKTGTVGGTSTQLYRFNNIISDATLGYSLSVAGTTMPFEIANMDFADGGGFTERAPDYNNALNFCYRNDGNGFSSSNTGFFLLFKQGITSAAVFNVSVPVENNVLPISTTGVNNTDVWVQTVDDAGNVLISWTKVPAIFNQNITYNNIPSTIRNIFSVITQDQDAISIRFSDGRFGAVPTGNIRVFYRTSNGLQYQIRPIDMSNISLVVPYYNAAGVLKNLTLTFSLQTAISNSVPRETNAQIKQRAPSVYATQNRMVSGEDYNTFPLQSNLAAKLQAVNRVYSGHSRFIDLNDPTGNYQDVNVFSDDGLFFQESYNIYTEVPITLNPTASDIVNLYCQPLLNRVEVSTFALNYLLGVQQSGLSNVWSQASTNAAFANTGYFATNNSFIVPGASLLFSLPSGKTQWATVVSINGVMTSAPPLGSPGPVTLSVSIPTNATLSSIIPFFQSGLDSNISATMVASITANQSFSLWYNYTALANGASTPWVLTNLTTNPGGTTFQVMTVVYSSGGLWSISATGSRYVFESVSNVQWYYDGFRTQDADTGEAVEDIIRILKVNENLNTGTGLGLPQHYDLNVNRIYFNRDGSINPLRVTVTLSDENLDGYPDVPDTFNQLVANSGVAGPETYLFFQQDDTYGDVPFTSMVVFEQEADRHTNTSPYGTVAFQINGASSTGAYNNSFWVQTSANGADSGWQYQQPGTYSYGIGRGANIAAKWYPAGLPSFVPTVPDNISFLWKHYASDEYRIDPARTNINDIFILTSSYDYLVRLWIANGCDPNSIPAPDTELSLRLAFEQYESYAMFSDQIVWRPVSYKYLFGTGADDTLQGTFKVVPAPNTTLSDGEIQAQVINAINAYFAVDNWDFGETFYYTELAAYIHQQLATVIASCVLVPTYSSSVFGDNFETRCLPNEIFISTAQVSNVEIISSNTPSQLRIR